MKMKTKFSENEAGITLLFNRASEVQTHNDVYAVFKKQPPLLPAGADYYLVSHGPILIILDNFYSS